MMKGFECRLKFRVVKIEDGKAEVTVTLDDLSGKPLMQFSTVRMMPESSLTFGSVYGFPRFKSVEDIMAELIFDPDTVEIAIRSPDAH